MTHSIQPNTQATFLLKLQEVPPLTLLDLDLKLLQGELDRLINITTPGGIPADEHAVLVQFIENLYEEMETMKADHDPLSSTPEFQAIEDALDQPLIPGQSSLIDAAENPSFFALDNLVASLNGAGLTKSVILERIALFLYLHPSVSNSLQ